MICIKSHIIREINLKKQIMFLKKKNNNISALEHKNGMLQKELNISNQEVEEMNRRIN